MEYRNNNNTINRDGWEFSYKGKEIAVAAEAKRVYRQSRVDWWTEEEKRIMAETKEKGLELVESVASSYTNGAGAAKQMVVRPEYQKKLNECHERLQKHMTAVREYDGWAQVLSANPEAELALTYADWLYFFGKN